jgi:hypothetical protein
MPRGLTDVLIQDYTRFRENLLSRTYRGRERGPGESKKRTRIYAERRIEYTEEESDSQIKKEKNN